MAADFTISDVLAWARTKPADATYNYGDCGNCALCQFLMETGRCAAPSVGGSYWSAWSGSRPYSGKRLFRQPLPDGLQYPLQAGTFGGLVRELETLCPDSPVTQSDWAAIDAYLTDIEQVDA